MRFIISSFILFLVLFFLQRSSLCSLDPWSARQVERIVRQRSESRRPISQARARPRGFLPYPESGYYTVNKTNGVHLFYVLSPSLDNATDAPICLWLQGGPGAASTMGMVVENGEWLVSKDLETFKNPFPWNAKINMLYIDQPAGAGWSYVENPAGYIHTVAEAAEQLYSALLQFFSDHPQYKSVDFYISGESYGGKWVPAISHKIMQSGGIPNFRGLLIADGLVDPISQFSDYAATAYYESILGWNQMKHFEELQTKLIQQIVAGQWDDAYDSWSDLVLVEFEKVSGGVNFYDIRVHGSYHVGQIPEWMELPWVRSMFRIPNGVQYNASSYVVLRNFKADFCQSVGWMLEDLLNSEFEVLLFVGQFDFILNSACVDSYVRNLNWYGRVEFNKLSREVWLNSAGELAGYQKMYGNLKLVVVADAGHMSSMDQRQNVQEMVEDFIFSN